VLLEKDRGTPTISRMRMIYLVESNLNSVTRLMWGRELMKHNEKFTQFHDNQYGGRQNRQGVSVALNKKITIDVARHYKETWS